jgi:hypothetical protein
VYGKYVIFGLKNSLELLYSYYWLVIYTGGYKKKPVSSSVPRKVDISFTIALSK